MLHPGMCSATLSVSRTGLGPGALATASDFHPSSGMGRLGPPTPAYFPSLKARARNLSQWGSGYASSSMNATISPVAASIPVFRALLSPRFSVLIGLKGYSDAILGVESVDPSLTTMTSKEG